EDAKDVARFYQLLEQLKVWYPSLDDMDKEEGRAFNEVLDLSHAIWGGCAQKGIRMGAAFGYLRQALLSPARLCPDCFGTGVKREGGGPCYRCDKTGAVAMEGYFDAA